MGPVLSRTHDIPSLPNKSSMENEQNSESCSPNDDAAVQQTARPPSQEHAATDDRDCAVSYRACDAHSPYSTDDQLHQGPVGNYSVQLELLQKDLYFERGQLCFEREQLCLEREKVKQLTRQLQIFHHDYHNSEQAWRKELYARNAELTAYREKLEVLRSQVETLENAHARNAAADSGSYSDSAPTPPLLQAAVDAFTEAVAVCASEMFSKLRRQTDVVNALLADAPLQQKSSFTAKIALQGLLCRNLLNGFEEPCFALGHSRIPPFQIPSERKRELFQAFKMYRDAEIRQLFEEVEDFRTFAGAMAQKVSHEIMEKLAIADTNNDRNGQVTTELGFDLIEQRKFVRAAKCVWALHKLAMAFDPIAEIFRVGRGSLFNHVYMEDTAHDEADTEENQSSAVAIEPEKKQVWCTCSPGFLVRQTVIKCRVSCLSVVEQPQGRDASRDSPVPMTIEGESS